MLIINSKTHPMAKTSHNSHLIRRSTIIRKDKNLKDPNSNKIWSKPKATYWPSSSTRRCSLSGARSWGLIASCWQMQTITILTTGKSWMIALLNIRSSGESRQTSPITKFITLLDLQLSERTSLSMRKWSTPIGKERETRCRKTKYYGNRVCSVTCPC